MFGTKKMLFLFLFILSIFGITGCGKQTNQNINAGMAAIDKLEYENALTLFEKAIVNQEDLELAYRGQGIAYMGMTRYEDAIVAFEKALDHSGMFAGKVEYDINYYLATAKYKKGDIEGSVQNLDAIIKLHAKEKDAYLLRGSAKLDLEDYDAGIKDLEMAMKLSGNSTDTIIAVFQIMQDRGYEENGFAYLEKALKKGAGTISDYETGTIYYYLKDYDNARNFLEKANAEENKDKKEEIVKMLGQTYEQLGDTNYASVLYAKYVEQNPKSIAIYNQLGLSKLELGMNEEALAAFQKAIEITPNEMLQTLTYNEIVAYEKLGEFGKAKVLMETYLQSYPDDEKANREYVFLQSR